MKMKNLTKRILVALALGMFAFQPNTQALPTGLQSEDAKQITADNVMNVIGQNQNNVLNWQSFNIAAGETVNFTNALNYLNLVRGYDMSRIYGTMNGDGNIILINPNGILFGAGANINVGSLYASTRGIDDGVINQFKADGTIGALGLGKSADGNITMALANVKNADSVVLEGNRVVIQDLSQMKDIKMIDAQTVGIGSKTGSLKDADGSLTTYNAAVKDKLNLHQNDTRYMVKDESGKNVVDTTPADYDVFEKDYNKSKWYAVSAYKTISNVDELNAMGGTSDTADVSHYMLVSDIDMGGALHKGIGITSNLGNDNHDRGATFNGMGYTISNMGGSDGLFSANNINYLRVKDISNINFVGAKIVNKEWNEKIFGYTASGVLAGKFYSDTPTVIDNVNVDATSSVSGVADVGGLIGNFQAGYFGSEPQMGTIKNSSNAASVTGADTYGESQKYDGINVGGIVGTGFGTLTNVSNSGIIKADGSMDIPNDDRTGNLYSASYAGGIAGQWMGYGDITYAANTGNVTGKAGMVGGIVGTAPANLQDPKDPVGHSGEFTNIAHAYNTGEISGTTGMVGGIVGAYIVAESELDNGNVRLEDVHTTKGGITNVIVDHGATISGANNAAFLHVTGSHAGGVDGYGTKTDVATVQKNIDASMGTNLQGLDVSKTGNLDIPDDPRNVITPAEQAKIDKLSGYNETISKEAAAINGIVSNAESAKNDVVSANDSAQSAMTALSEAEKDPDTFAALAPGSKATAEAAITKSNTAMTNLHSMADEATTAFNTAKKAYDDAKALNGISDTFKTELAKLEANYNAAKANYDKIVAAEVAAKKVNEYVKIEDYAKWIDEMIAAHGGSNPPVNPPVNPPTPPIITPEELPEKIKEIINDGNANADVVGRVVVEAIVGSDKAENVVAEIDSATTAAAAEGKTTATVSTEDTTGNSVPAPAASDSGNGAAEEEKAVTFEG